MLRQIRGQIQHPLPSYLLPLARLSQNGNLAMNDKLKFTFKSQAGLTANFAFSIHKLAFALFPLLTPTLIGPEELT